MTIKSLIDQAFELAGSTISDATMLSFFNEIEGRVAMEWLGAREWTPYTEADLQKEPILTEPWARGIYVPYLEAMLYYTHGENDRYENARTMHENNYLELRKHAQRKLPPCWQLYDRSEIYFGLSTDNKPSCAPRGSAYFETDTRALFFWDAECCSWIAIGDADELCERCRVIVSPGAWF